jgi:small subunit ribosomal protein S18
MEENKDRPRAPFKRKRYFGKGAPYKRKVCRFCTNKNLVIDYKNVDMVKSFTTERGRIIPCRITGNCAIHQRRLAKAIKRAREIGLLSLANN